MPLFLVSHDQHDGDADGPFNMDLFVRADTRPEAALMWLTHYEREADEIDWPVKVMIVPESATDGPIGWDSIDIDSVRKEDL